MSNFLNIRGSGLELSCKKVLLTFLQISLKNIKNIRDAVFNLKFQAKSQQLEKRLRHMCFPKNFPEVLRKSIFQKTKANSICGLSCFFSLLLFLSRLSSPLDYCNLIVIHSCLFLI